jgi:hypothetical protein
MAKLPPVPVIAELELLLGAGTPNFSNLGAW